MGFLGDALDTVAGIVIAPCTAIARGLWASTFEVYDLQTKMALKQRDQFFRYRGSKPPINLRGGESLPGNYLVSEYRTQLGSKIPQTAFDQIYVYPVVDKKSVGDIEAPVQNRVQVDRAFHAVMGQVSSYNVGAALSHVISLATIRSEGSARAINNVDKMEQGRYELFDDAAFARKMQALNVGVTVGNTAVAGQATAMQAVQSQLGSLAASKAQGTSDILTGVGRLASDMTDRFSGNKSADGAQSNASGTSGSGSIRQPTGQVSQLDFEQDTGATS